MRTRVKICGITRVEDAKRAVEVGADSIGVVFYPPSPRAVTPEQAAAISTTLPPFITVTGLFVDAKQEQVEAALAMTRIDLLQFHGQECNADCVGFKRPFIKAIRVHEGLDLVSEIKRYPDACGILLDSFCEGVPGGSGQRFDWSMIPNNLHPRLILAGGLNPENVASAVRQVRPYAVDVSSGVEQTPGVKDERKMAAFMKGTGRVDEP